MSGIDRSAMLFGYWVAACFALALLMVVASEVSRWRKRRSLDRRGEQMVQRPQHVTLPPNGRWN